MEAEVSEGLRYRLGDVTFVDNHAFDAATLRREFPLKTGQVFDREKVAVGLEALRKLYGSSGFLDYIGIPETRFDSNASASLVMTFEEGPQYHMGKLEFVGDKQAAARLRAAWTLTEGAIYDNTYLDQYLTANRNLLPANFSRQSVQISQSCPEAQVAVRIILDPAEDKSPSLPGNIPCEESPKKPHAQSDSK
jgi:outer membrane protein assembly factor BamA